MPDILPAPAIGPLEVLVPLGYVSLFVVITSRALAQAPLVPRHDPYLDESLHHHCELERRSEKACRRPEQSC